MVNPSCTLFPERVGQEGKERKGKQAKKEWQNNDKTKSREGRERKKLIQERKRRKESA